MESSLAVRLVVPGELVYRDLAIRTIAEASRLVSRRRLAGANGGARGESTAQNLDLTDPFDAELVSAFSEIFNNIALYSYDQKSGDIEVEIQLSQEQVSIVLRDTGDAFDIEAVPPPELESMPQGGMGIHIARAFVDELDYQAGPPNVWRLTKRASMSAAVSKQAMVSDGE